MNPDDYESPFLDAEMPFLPSRNGGGEAPPDKDHESRFDELFSGVSEAEAELEEEAGTELEAELEVEPEAEAETGLESAFEAELEAEQSERDPGLFDPAELETVWAEPETAWAEPEPPWAEPELEEEAASEPDDEVEAESAGEAFEEESWITPELPGAQMESPFLEGELEEESGPEDEGEVLLLGEEEGETGADVGQIVLLKKELEDVEEEAPAPTTPVQARILWPALGFPAVIAPRPGATGSPFTDGDATRCITVLLRSNRKNLSKAEAAASLRYVVWNDRGRRHIEAVPGTEGWFREEELAVRNNEAGPKLVLPTPKGSAGMLIAFGGDRNGNNAITVHLANAVSSFYDRQGLKYLHEIRVSEEASARLAGKQYHLFWNNRSKGENVPSDEMQLLLRKFAQPRREALGELYEQRGEYLLREYEWEYGLEHPPYHSNLRMRKIRTEVLHPLFVRKPSGGPLRIGHITDAHVDVRADVYEENLRRARSTAQYNNWNRSFVRVYQDAKRRSDVLLLTGDLIDYGRGHWGLNAGDRVGDDSAYHVDRNWFLFTYLLAGDDAYTVPTYTILGNHDWRLNPYPPFAPGAPSPSSLLHDYRKYNEEERKRILRTAHGPGHERAFSYYWKAKGKLELLAEATGSAVKALWKMFLNRSTMDEPNTPAHTTVESVLWYLLTINPFLDYSFTLPGGQRVLMLDWAEDEDLLFPIPVKGKSWPFMVWQAERAAGDAPKARSALTAAQWWMARDFIGRRGAAKVIGIHAPPIGPYSDWYDVDLYRGRKLYGDEKEPRGPTNYATRYADGRVERWNGHPLFAIRPKNGPDGTVADCGSLVRNRDEFIRAVAKPGSGVRAVLSGHIHRNNLLLTWVSDARSGPAVAGQVRIRAITPQLVKGARPPAVASVPEAKSGPLYINTTSAGPRGYFYPSKGKEELVNPGYALLELAADGTIGRVEFVAPPIAAPAPAVVRREVDEPELVSASAAYTG